MVNEINNNYFSIVVPLYNKADYIERAVQSILNQSYQYFEIIVVNDGSVDGGERKVELIDDKRILLINQQNQGVSVARNTGAKSARYDYLAFLDGDDIWHPSFLEEVNLLINNYPNAGIYGTNNYFEYPSGKVFYEKYDWLFGGEKSGIIKDYFSVFAHAGKSPFSNSNLCIPAKIYEEIGGYNEKVRLTEDSDLWCRISLKYDIAYLKKPLSTYYIGTLGSTHYLFEPKDFQITITLENALKSNQVKPDQINSVRKLIAFQKMSLIKRSILTGHKLYALKKIGTVKLIVLYPLEVIKCLASLMVSPRFLMKLNGKKYS